MALYLIYPGANRLKIEEVIVMRETEKALILDDNWARVDRVFKKDVNRAVDGYVICDSVDEGKRALTRYYQKQFRDVSKALDSIKQKLVECRTIGGQS